MDAAQPISSNLDQSAVRARIDVAARDFEASFLSVMLGQMFQGLGAEAPFNGGPGEAAFKSFLTEAMAKQVTKAGGVGLSDRVAREMLKLQGLS